jgi:hypothetical protein
MRIDMWWNTRPRRIILQADLLGITPIYLWDDWLQPVRELLEWNVGVYTKRLVVKRVPIVER